MSTVPTQIRIDSSLKKEASELFSKLGLDMSSAVNIFLRQCVLREGIPFEVSMPKYKPEVMQAMEEAEKISLDPNAKTYDSFSQILKELD